MNLDCATGHPSFVMSTSFTNQTLDPMEHLHDRSTRHGLCEGRDCRGLKFQDAR